LHQQKKRIRNTLSSFRLIQRRRGMCVTQSSIVFAFLGKSLSLQPPDQFLLCLPVGHSPLHEDKDQLIHELIQLREPPCDFLFVHSRRDWQISILISLLDFVTRGIYYWRSACRARTEFACALDLERGNRTLGAKYSIFRRTASTSLATDTRPLPVSDSNAQTPSHTARWFGWYGVHGLTIPAEAEELREQMLAFDCVASRLSQILQISIKLTLVLPIKRRMIPHPDLRTSLMKAFTAVSAWSVAAGLFGANNALAQTAPNAVTSVPPRVTVPEATNTGSLLLPIVFAVLLVSFIQTLRRQNPQKR
jgi:hypothetical protein